MFIDEINIPICGHRILLKSIESFVIFFYVNFCFLLQSLRDLSLAYKYIQILSNFIPPYTGCPRLWTLELERPFLLPRWSLQGM